jgi:hypothetical protein
MMLLFLLRIAISAWTACPNPLTDCWSMTFCVDEAGGGCGASGSAWYDFACASQCPGSVTVLVSDASVPLVIQSNFRPTSLTLTAQDVTGPLTMTFAADIVLWSFNVEGLVIVPNSPDHPFQIRYLYIGASASFRAGASRNTDLLFDNLAGETDVSVKTVQVFKSVTSALSALSFSLFAVAGGIEWIPVAAYSCFDPINLPIESSGRIVWESGEPELTFDLTDRGVKITGAGTSSVTIVDRLGIGVSIFLSPTAQANYVIKSSPGYKGRSSPFATPYLEVTFAGSRCTDGCLPDRITVTGSDWPARSNIGLVVSGADVIISTTEHVGVSLSGSNWRLDLGSSSTHVNSLSGTGKVLNSNGKVLYIDQLFMNKLDADSRGLKV